MALLGYASWPPPPGALGTLWPAKVPLGTGFTLVDPGTGLVATVAADVSGTLTIVDEAGTILASGTSASVSIGAREGAAVRIAARFAPTAGSRLIQLALNGFEPLDEQLLTIADANTRYLLKTGVYQPELFGAIGDGVTDDTAALTACVAAAVSSGGAVELGPYTYKISAAIPIAASLYGVTIRGFGRASKIVQSNLTADFFVLGDGGTSTFYNGVFADFCVTSASTQTAGWVFNGSKLARCSWTRIGMQDAQDVQAGKSIFAGIKLDRFDDCAITDCQIEGSAAPTGGDGVRCNGANDQTFGADLTFSGGSKIAGFNYGIRIAGGAGGVAIDETNIIANNYNIGIDTTVAGVNNREIFLGAQAILDSSVNTNLLVAASSVIHLDVQGSWIASAGQGHVVTDAANVKIAAQNLTAAVNLSNCRIYSAYGPGVVINGQCRVVIDGAIIEYNGLGATLATHSGVAVQNTNVDLILTNCQIFNNGAAGIGYGFYETGSSHTLVLDGNIFKNNAAGPAPLIGLDSNVTMRDNVGLVTSNSDSTQILAGTSSIVVTHGLINTPQSIQVTPWNSDPGDRYWVSAVGLTTFTINFTANAAVNKAFFWRAVTGLGY